MSPSLSFSLFALEEKKGLFSRLFSRKTPDELGPISARPARERSAEELRRLAEAKALVDEALSER